MRLIQAMACIMYTSLYDLAVGDSFQTQGVAPWCRVRFYPASKAMYLPLDRTGVSLNAGIHRLPARGCISQTVEGAE